MKKAVVLGGGFAGVEAAIFLRKEGFAVDLISPRPYMYIYPTSIWVPVYEAEFADVCIPMSELSEVHGFTYIQDSIEKIDAKNKKAVGKKGEYSGNFLVIAMGAGKVKHEGSEHYMSICGEPEDAIRMRDRLDLLITAKGHGKIAMGFGGNPKDSSAVRGGPAFEMIFNVHNYLKKKGLRDKFELTFFATMAEPGKRLGPQALKMMDVFFNKLGIKKHFGKKIKRFEKNGIVFEDDFLESDYTMFIPANAGHPVFQESDLPLSEAGFILVDEYCEVKEKPGVYAIGDSAYIEGPQWRAKQGHIAEVMARNTANNIAIDAGVKVGKKESYIEHLNIICVMDSGDGAAFVYRDEKRGFMLPMPFVGHWLKKGWGWYCRNSKLNKIPRLPGL
ncbi:MULTISPECIES: NAD(P)/FAD-dependent oxidoreductase [unclassified Nitratiruptor]|uniref:NAD(P)/FAD-dependent oxidoreductase n=1 Tax=unclassified Nitratiruptor TaxID=2624044 RepID=UPI0019169300|nr:MULTISPECIES: FAD-dependent oxidoreductase [unclassified Nitratiruptor]BCD59413.1 sulfide:quinone oxidoreductase [Nitratiruptor sp. YY08-10]BCD63337.1 sulfide:quinone oxidoreductase [Nitratiruptor sp. YY08-14]